MSIGVTPVRITQKNILKGGYAEATLLITTGEDQTIEGHIEPSSQFSGWIKTSTNSTRFTLDPGRTQPFTLIIQPPKETPSGNYSGYVDIVTDTVATPSGRAAGLALSGVRVKLDIEVVGTQIQTCNAGAVYLRDIEEGYPIELTGRIVNTGNVLVEPSGTIEIFNRLKTERIARMTFQTSRIRPTTYEEMNVILSRLNLKPGIYPATITIPECDIVKETAIHIHEEGTMQDSGQLVSVSSSAYAYKEDDVAVRARFTNTGQRTALSQFKGTITYDNQLIRELTSERIQVAPGDTEEFIMFFVPEYPGRYLISGKVIFNEKSSNEMGTIVTVSDESAPRSNNLALVVYIALLLAVFYLGRKIIKARQKRRKPY